MASGFLSYSEYLRAHQEVLLDSSRRAVARARRVLNEAETGQRGYLLTGKAAYLTSYTRATSMFEGVWQEVYATSYGKLPFDVNDFHARSLLKMDELAQTVELYRTNHPEQALARVNDDQGQALMEGNSESEGIRTQVDSYLDNSYLQLLALQSKARDVLIFQVICALMGACVVSLTYVRLYRLVTTGQQANRLWPAFDKVLEEARREGI